MRRLCSTAYVAVVVSLVSSEKNNITVGRNLCKDVKNSRFDQGLLECIQCGDHQQVSSDGLKCECEDSAYIYKGSISYYQPGVIAPFNCQPCPSGKIPSQDRLFCVTPATKNCNTRERTQSGSKAPSGQCYTCDVSVEDVDIIAFHPSPDGMGRCVACPSPGMRSINGDCRCIPGYRKSADNRCFKDRAAKDSYNARIDYNDGTSVQKSKTVAALFETAYLLCNDTEAAVFKGVVDEEALAAVSNASAPSSGNATTSWAIIKDGCSCSNNGIKPTSTNNNVPSLQACKSECNAQTNCVALDYNDKTKECILYATACTDPTKCAEGWVSLSVEEPQSTYMLSGRNHTACQVLANLCVLQMYDNSVADGACAKFEALLGTPGKNPSRFGRHKFLEWPVEFPWILYNNSKSRAYSAAYDPEVSLEGSLKAVNSDQVSSNSVSSLHFEVAVYNLHGRYLGMRDFTKEIMACPGSKDFKSSWLRFGTTFQDSCKLSLSDLPLGGQDEMLFYEPYFLDNVKRGNTWTAVYYPAPVLVSNYKSKSKELINSNEDLEDDFFTRRFFMYDNVSSTIPAETRASKIRVATHIEVAIRLRPDQDSRIFPPVIKVSYSDITLASGVDPEIEFTFKATYMSDADGYEEYLESTVAIVITLSSVLAYISIRTERDRNQMQAVDVTLIATCIHHLSAAVSTAMIIPLSCCSLYFLIFAKNQEYAYVFAPENDKTAKFEIFLIVGTCFKILHVLFILHAQSNVDIFFIDRETPKRKASKSRNAPPNSSGANAQPPKKRDGSVGAWRRLFIANEWNELQCVQPISMDALISIVVFILYVSDVDKLAKQNPHVSDEYDGEDSKILRVAVITIIYFPIGIGIWLGRTLFYNRFVADKLGSFEDLCSLANISILILTHKCHGYYIHGKNVYGYADVSMSIMQRRLNREEEGTVATRGLLPESDHQAFEINVPPKVFEKWNDSLLNKVDRRNFSSSDADSTAKAYEDLNRFFNRFMSHSFGEDLDFVVKETSFWANKLGLEAHHPKRATFYKDNYRGYTLSILWGHQVSLLLCAYSIFILVDWFHANWIAGAICAWACHKAFETAADYLSAKNLERKALIGQAFLL